jgi:hypothetical protein
MRYRVTRRWLEHRPDKLERQRLRRAGCPRRSAASRARCATRARGREGRGGHAGACDGGRRARQRVRCALLRWRGPSEGEGPRGGEARSSEARRRLGRRAKGEGGGIWGIWGICNGVNHRRCRCRTERPAEGWDWRNRRGLARFGVR